jgi:hypothetical protein
MISLWKVSSPRLLLDEFLYLSRQRIRTSYKVKSVYEIMVEKVVRFWTY